MALLLKHLSGMFTLCLTSHVAILQERASKEGKSPGDQGNQENVCLVPPK